MLCEAALDIVSKAFPEFQWAAECNPAPDWTLCWWGLAIVLPKEARGALRQLRTAGNSPPAADWLAMAGRLAASRRGA